MDEQATVTDEQAAEFLAEFLEENQTRIDWAVLYGMLTTDNVAQALIDPSVGSPEQWQQFFVGLDTAGHAVLTENISTAFQTIFHDVSDELRTNLCEQSATIVRENLSEYIHHLMCFAARQRSIGSA